LESALSHMSHQCWHSVVSSISISHPIPNSFSSLLCWHKGVYDKSTKITMHELWIGYEIGILETTDWNQCTGIHAAVDERCIMSAKFSGKVFIQGCNKTYLWCVIPLCKLFVFQVYYNVTLLQKYIFMVDIFAFPMSIWEN
jgi:hypothetical protein